MSVLPNFSVLIVAQPQKLPNSKLSSDICLSYDTFEEMSQRGPRDGWRALESLRPCAGGRRAVQPRGGSICIRLQNRQYYDTFCVCCKNRHPTARIVSQLGGKADDRAEAPTGGLCRTASWVHEKPKPTRENPNLHAKPEPT